ncbi:type I-E CRISPR-associated protein Cse1/CasA [Alloalcanivorax sp. C16-1]|uniref:type I-E CRISPR-associated protein Cse1/CasA n=1 Tax=Alloalcanivorax sp. C16-1 TaxID=3390051 RepID=UPI003970898D
MNLLASDWIAFKTGDGRVIYRPPSAIADKDIVDLALPRADFQGAAYQWLIGLLQTALPPKHHVDWLEHLTHQPDQKALEEAFAPFLPAFELDGDGPRFMQDLDPLDDAKPSPVAGLLIDAPGANGIKNNTDFFVKRGGTEVMCPDCAAMALFTMQINAPSGGAGYRVGLRGGGPLTTLILPEAGDASLWQRLWLNVMPTSVFDRDGQACAAPSAEDGTLFPWVAPTRESKAKNTEVFPEQMHPLHPYWAMPRRFRLMVEDQPCRCDLCGREAQRSVREVRAKNYGANYAGPWLHPLTPYRTDPKKPQEPPLSSKGQPGGIGYRNWSYLVLPDPSNTGALPAKVVRDFLGAKYQTSTHERAWGQEVEALLTRPRLWVFGYDMDNMKARCWYGTEMPLVVLPEAQQDAFRSAVQQFTELSRQVAWHTRRQILSAWFERPGDAKGDTSYIEAQFYEDTEGAFFQALENIKVTLVEQVHEADLADPANLWFRALRSESLALFEDKVLNAAQEALNWKRAVSARAWLLTVLSGQGKGAKPIKQFADYYDVALTRSKSDTTKREETA